MYSKYMNEEEYFTSLAERSPVRRIGHSENLHLADPELEYVENQGVHFGGVDLNVRLFLGQRHEIASSNPFTRDPKYLDIPIQRMPDEKDNESIDFDIDAYIRVEYDTVLHMGNTIEPIDIFDADSYKASEVAEGMTTAKKLTYSSLGLLAVAAGAAAAGGGFVRFLKKRQEQ